MVNVKGPRETGNSKRERKRPRENDVTAMMELFSNGSTYQTIAKRTGFHWQTVRKYVRQRLQEGQGEQIRAEAMKQALWSHFEDMVSALQYLSDLIPSTDQILGRIDLEHIFDQGKFDLRERLLLVEALQAVHAADSNIWNMWKDLREKSEALQLLNSESQDRIHSTVTQAMNDKPFMQGLYPDPVTELVLQHHRAFVLHHGTHFEPDDLWVEDSKLNLGRGATLGECGDPQKAKEYICELADNIQRSTEAVELQEKVTDVEELIEQVKVEIEKLRMRRAFPGRCDLCPI